MSRNLITGGFGFVGSYLARHLVGEGQDVVIFDKATGSDLVDHMKGNVKAVHGDLINLAQMFETVKMNRIDTIYHLGSLLPPQSEESLWMTYQVNVTGTINVLETARVLQVANVVYASTMGTYLLEQAAALNEDSPQAPRSMYGTSKLCSDRLGEQYQRKYGVNFRAVRFPALLGPGRPGVQFMGARPGLYVTHVIEEAILGRPCSIPVTGETRIPTLYVKDAVRSLLKLKEANEAQLKRRVYNIHGFSVAAKELVEAVVRHIPQAQMDFKPDQGIIDQIRRWPQRFDDTRAREEWGWEPKYDLDKAIEDFIAEKRASRVVA